MSISIFSLFKIGIGPSSSHTVGPMKAAGTFRSLLDQEGLVTQLTTVTAHLYGSLALTGLGHGTDKAIILGLSGQTPQNILPEDAEAILARVEKESTIDIFRDQSIPWKKSHLKFHRRKSLPSHPNGLKFEAMDKSGKVIKEASYYSIGGGFVVDQKEFDQNRMKSDRSDLPYLFLSGEKLLDYTSSLNLSIATLMMANEKVWHDENTINQQLDHIWDVMESCIQRGLTKEGLLPGGLKVKRRAAAIYKKLSRNQKTSDPLAALDWVNLYALAVNEENASGSRVVTAPTNGAAGIIPAVIKYYLEFCNGNKEGVREFLLTSGAIGILYKENASISGAEVGCQGEVGVACSMAAAGLVATLGGTPKQAEQAAEIGMEHNLGLTCDPIGGLVQIPCIERNAMGAVKAINAARIALQGDGHHYVSLDSVMKTMKQTGKDMQTKYKETSRGGLAVNVTEC